MTRLFVLPIVGAYLVFNPIHLATETHDFGTRASQTSVAAHKHHHDDHSHDHGDHHPHNASDHELQLACKSIFSDFLLVYVSLSETWTIVFPEFVSFSDIRSDWLKPPGESPPEPSQPRAPPIA
jgi:hypothetical protein